MKKLVQLFVIVSMLFTFVPSSADARSKRTKPTSVSVADTERAKQLTARLEEIKAMDKSTLTAAQKRALRVEVRAIKKEAEAMSGGVYISLGALLIIVLLILLL